MSVLTARCATPAGAGATRWSVALVTDAVAPFNRGGKEERYRELAPRIAAHAQVCVYTMRWWGTGDEVELDRVRYRAICPHLPLYSGERRSIRQAVVFALACLRLLGADVDVIEADHMPYIQLFVLRLVAWLRRVPLVVTWHEAWDGAQWRRYLGRMGSVAWIIERVAMLLPDRIVAASPETGQRVTTAVAGRTPVTIAPNGIDARAIDAVAPSDEGADIVTVGRMLSHKRMDRLIEAVALLAAGGHRYSCLIIGDGPERENLAAQIRELDLESQVTLRSDITEHAELLARVKGSRCFAFPSEREGFGIAALEAIACGTPVITTSAPDNLAQSLVQRSASGVVCEPTAAALAEAIHDRLSTPPSRSPGIDPWVHEYDWNATAASVLSALGIDGADGELRGDGS
jgi:glycosyltransferase involved in cell wall biosynthesis